MRKLNRSQLRRKMKIVRHYNKLYDLSKRRAKLLKLRRAQTLELTAACLCFEIRSLSREKMGCALSLEKFMEEKDGM